MLVRVPDPADLAAARGWLTRPRPDAAHPAHPRLDARSSHPVEVQVSYDGPDLAEVARLTGMTPDDVVRAHTAPTYRVAFIGFAPGFAYLVGGDPRLVVPRRATPRTSVPAGSVGLAGELSGIYPRPSPMVRGAVQVPPDGRPVVFLADHPVTGGYPVVGVLTEADVDRAAQLRPGQPVRLLPAPRR